MGNSAILKNLLE